MVLDGNPVVFSSIGLGDTVLMLERAYIYENAEQHDCCHGPWGKVVLKTFNTEAATDYGGDFDQMRSDYLGVDWFFNYSGIGGQVQLPGPTYTANNPCSDIFSHPSCFGAPTNPWSEWTDGPIGIQFSRFAVLNWNSSVYDPMPSVALFAQENDGTSPDDLMGAMPITRSFAGPIYFYVWKHGWLQLRNVVKSSSNEYFTLAGDPYSMQSIDYCDHYWMNKKEVSSFSGVIEQSAYLWDQYSPMGQVSIETMEALFSADQTIGLLGREFPTGLLSKPMRYSAPCEPALFGP